MLLSASPEARVHAHLGAIVVGRARLGHASQFKVVLTLSQAFAHTVHATRVWAARSKGFLRARHTDPADRADTSAVQATTMTTAPRRASFVSAPFTIIPLVALARAVYCCPMWPAVGQVAIDTLPAIDAQARTLGATAVARAHLGPAARLRAVLAGEATVTLAYTSDTLSIARAVLGALEVCTRWTCEVG